MHKIAKGLKKKKKGKKSKHKEEELFKPEELEAYRREHAATGEEGSAKNEEWKNFLSLTSGVDDILKKTQDDLDRIKSTSFFQRIPPSSKTEKEKKPEPSQTIVENKKEDPVLKQEDPSQLGIVPVSESESEEEEDDDIFDTTYIDAIAAGEVKLAYIPESPTEKQEGDDPFDTSIAERAILGPAVERKGKKLVPLGAAVEVLTGRVQLPTCATKPVSSRRQILKQRDLLLGSFDNSENVPPTNSTAVTESPEQIKTLLDDDEIPLPDEPIDLSKTLYIPPPQPLDTAEDKSKNIVKEFEDDEDKEFEALAAESLSKTPLSVVTSEVLQQTVVPVGVVEDASNWKPFGSDEPKTDDLDTEVFEDDPFDTTFAERILPGKAELKLIEKEILENDVDFDPRAEQANSQSVLLKDRIPESQLNLITPVQRDLLGGSTSDLSKLGDAPIQPTGDQNSEDIKYCDPFDTSLIDSIKAPGQAELKFLEKELLGDIKSTTSVLNKTESVEDDDFDPRATESRPKERTLSRPDVLNVGQSKSVSFSVPGSEKGLLGLDEGSKVPKPLTPFYVRKNSVPGTQSSEEDDQDPFDTSFVSSLAPGKAELKVIESELFDSSTASVLDDQDFDPRDEAKVAKVTVVEAIKEIANPKPKPDVLPLATQSLDLLSASNDTSAKVLTPVTTVAETTKLSYADPFDTSIAKNILPGKAELKLLENELIKKKEELTEPNRDLLVHSGDTIIEKPLSPELDIEIEEDNFDPFDTSFASNIQPGKAELKVLESELYNRLKMAVNPFLFQDEGFGSPENQFQNNSNPFLMEEEPAHNDQILDDNPFLSQSAVAVTNPFAFDPMDLEPAEAQVPNNVPTSNAFGDMSSTSQDFFSTGSNTTATTNADLLSGFSTNTSINNFVSQPEQITTTAQKPSDLDLKYSHQSFNGPARPPPPRPTQSKETQDLLMSVMGAMDATSSHLLDKIPPTRTPSPVSMRDLQSPSPTPEPTFGDLLDVGESTHKAPEPAQEDLLSLNSSTQAVHDINQNPSVTQVPQRPVMPPSRPAPPVRPPRPAPPQKPPPPPITARSPNFPPNPVPSSQASNAFGLSQNVNKPTEPTQKAPEAQQNQAQNDIMDMFDVSVSQQPKVASKADILNLYNVPKQEKVQPDLLCDVGFEAESKTPTITENLVSEDLQIKEEDSGFVGEANDDLTPTNQPEVAKDNVLSPEPSAELQMDTSDSQSKGSVSSVTFNPFSVSDDFGTQSKEPDLQQDNLDSVFKKETDKMDIFSTPAPAPTPIPGANSEGFDFDSAVTNTTTNVAHFQPVHDEFDAFAEKFESVKSDENKNGGFDAFGGGVVQGDDVWGNDFGSSNQTESGFGNDGGFDEFLAMRAPPGGKRRDSQDSDEEKDFSVVIRPKTEDAFSGITPILAPPPAQTQVAFSDTSPRFNPFDQQTDVTAAVPQDQAVPFSTELKRSDSQESPSTPLFDDDTSQPLEDFPRIKYNGEGWEMHLRQPNKKKITGQRFWKKVLLKLQYQQDCVLLQLYNQQSDKDPFQELPLQPCYSVSEIGAQQYDQFGKIFTIKLQYIFYKERPGVRPGQVKKAERITNKLSQFAAYAIQGDYQGVKEFGSDLKKLGLPVEHAPQVSQVMKLGSLSYEDLKQFSFCIEEALFRLQAHRDRALHYKMEEVQVTVVDELYVEQSSEGYVEKQIARVRLFFLGFLTGMPDIELGINDMRRQGREVVGRHDIIPVVTEEWIRLENVEFHSCVQQDEYENTHIIKFKPPDACYIELMRFRVRPPKNRELPLQLKAQICVTGMRVELRADVLVPGFASRKLGQIPCEDVMIRFPIPECWIYMFRVEKHFRYGSVKSAHRRTGKIKGIERILGTMDALQESLIEVTSGQAKYEHQHRAIVWRCPRLPKEGQGAYTTHNMVCRIALTSFDQMPEKLAEYCYVEFTMPATQVSHTTCRSVSLQNSDSDEPPEKYVRYLARHEYRVGIEHTEGEAPNAYSSATYVKTTAPAAAAPAPEKPAPVAEESSSDSD
ncbi:LOW QUALITY PROTEIN: protein stoned-B-like [Sitophilus oryzae]|uniref:LOW QUALITY PROTEIN: protein stoned-B-like n=1 Tax=Sitophilus oryzae TaxID=7048 RepID=A0A6J2YJM6_SITOR|nr:LOW QUALITY PROTEIN: protein stoned-B-like [Sitophilus oryzae]